MRIVDGRNRSVSTVAASVAAILAGLFFSVSCSSDDDSSGNGGAAPLPAGLVIPTVTGECPTFEDLNPGAAVDSTIDFMTLRGIEVRVGPKSNGTGALLLYFHGTGSFAGELALIPDAAKQQILDAGGIITSPQSSTGTTDGLQASGLSVWFKEDLDTVDQIVACAVRDYGIDPRRIYATGCSAGGLFTGYLATNRWQYIAAAAPNSGGSLTQFTDATRIPNVMTMHGAAGQDMVILDFAQQSLAFTSVVVSAGGFAIDCNHGGGHCRTPPELYTSAITFLLDHPFGVSPEPYASGLPAGFPAYCQVQ